MVFESQQYSESVDEVVTEVTDDQQFWALLGRVEGLLQIENEAAFVQKSGSRSPELQLAALVSE